MNTEQFDTTEPNKPPSNGLVNGLIGVLIFSATLPATRLAVPDLGPWLMAFGRASVAGICAYFWLKLNHVKLIESQDKPALWRTAFGIVFGFPLLSGAAMLTVPAAHGAVVIGLMPLVTALISARYSGERLSKGFWWAAFAGSAFVVMFALWRGAGTVHWGDLLLLGAVLTGSIGYADGGRLSKKYGGPQVVSMALTLTLPINIVACVVALFANDLSITRASQFHWSTWLSFAYVSFFSMWLGFFFWYKGLAQGGIAKVGQVQLLQPFLSVILAAIVLTEPFEWTTLAFALAVIACIAIGRRFNQSVAPPTR